ncbi:MAG: D-2-hydroxyacid dehydrogenase [Clostridiales bacterium]|jgi:D-3-phosphoglycerate dehydrogenase|nr:D-2-hydroxyacid dehydrogenase [Clostridiales bacterium]
MIRVLATDGMEKGAIQDLITKGYEVVEQFYEPEELAEKAKEYNVIVVRSATKVREPIIDAALTTGNLKLIIRGGVGVDNIDVAYAESKGIKVANTPNASSAAVAELAIAGMFSIARHLHAANHTMRLGQWNKKQYKGIELSGKTLGLVGFGRIAQETAKRGAALGMKIIYTDLLGANAAYPDFQFASFEEVLAGADFLSLHIPAKADKSYLLTAAEIAKMKDGAYLVNTSRGSLICEADLLAALDNGKLAGAYLDVFEAEPTKNEALYTHDKISFTPHIGGSTKEAQKRIGSEIVSIITTFFA